MTWEHLQRCFIRQERGYWMKKGRIQESHRKTVPNGWNDGNGTGTIMREKCGDD